MTTLAVCAIFKDEALNLTEWVAYHRAVGVDHFFLYDNESTDDGASILLTGPFKNYITVIPILSRPAQDGAYMHFIEFYANAWDWAAFIDLDEFIHPIDATSVKDLLPRYEESFSAILLHWLNFGPSNHNSRPNGLVIENYTCRLPESHSMNRHVKSIVRTAHLICESGGLHVFHTTGPLCNARGEPAPRLPFQDSICHDVMCINHYYTKSREDWDAKVRKGRTDKDPTFERPNAWFDEHAQLGVINDQRITRFATRVKNMMQGNICPPRSPVSRADKILKMIDPHGAGLEIGASFNPVAPKSAGYDVKILDFMSTEQLISLNSARNHDISKIENVDYIWDGRTFQEIVGTDKKFDWIIASHVLEHTPDIITFLNNCQSILTDNGVVSLAIPDKRYCFDYFRPVSSLSQVIDAFAARRKRHSPGSVMEYFLFHCWKDGALGWDRDYSGDMRFPYSIEFAKDMFAKATDCEDYIDIHAWCFTPSSFRLLVHDLASLGFITLHECTFFPTVGHEFFISMSDRGAGSQVSRVSLMHQTLEEARE